MKKVIKGKMYNTETAANVGCWDNGLYCNDLYYCSETLYKKKTGEFFIYGEGGAGSRYAGRDNDFTCYGEIIMPMSLQDAKEWAELKMEADTYIKVFGEPEE